MAINIKVNTQVMETKAKQISNEMKQFERLWRNLQATAEGTKDYWEGDASVKHQKHLKAAAGDVEIVIKRMNKHHIDLLKMAGIYEKTEAKSKQAANSLPADVL